MANIVLAFKVVFPLMLMMSIGYLLRRTQITDEHSLGVMNKLVFRVFLPILLFLNIYSLEPEEAINADNVKLIALVVVCILGTILLTHILFTHLIRDRKKISVMIQGIFRSNLVLFGIPIAASIYGDDHIGIVSLLAAVIVPLYNALAVILLEYYRGGKVKMRKLIVSIFKNPLIIASFIAFVLLMLHIELPDLLLNPISSMSKVATPLAFTVLGGTFYFKRLSGNLRYLVVVTLGRLVLLPVLMLGSAILLGFRNEALVALIGLAASPTAVSSFTMAMEMDADGELAGQIVIITSVACILTIFVWVLLLRACQFI